MENNTRPLCPKDGKPLFWLQEDFLTGRLFCLCGYSHWVYRDQRETTKEELGKIWAADGRFAGNNPGGPSKKLRTYVCIICKKEVTRIAYVSENLCGAKQCYEDRTMKYAVRSFKKRGLKLYHGKMREFIKKFGEGAV
jgi:hypothetical protein